MWDKCRVTESGKFSSGKMATQDNQHSMVCGKGAGRLEERSDNSNTQKGSRTECSNYRGNSLLSVPGKVCASIVGARVKQRTEGKILEVQGASGSVGVALTRYLQ